MTKVVPNDPRTDTQVNEQRTGIAGALPADRNSADTKSVDASAARADRSNAATKPSHHTDREAEQDPDEQDPDEQDPDEQDPDEQDPDEQDPDEQDPDEQDPDEQDPDPDPRRAAFLKDLPDSAELRPLVTAFAQGNYAQLRKLEAEIGSKTEDPEVLAAARELVERTMPDPLARQLLGLAVVFFLFIVGWVYLHHAH